MPLLIVPGATYFGGFSHLELTEPRVGRLVLEDDALTLSRVQNVKRNRDFRNIWLCRTLDIAAMEVTTTEDAQSKASAAVLDALRAAAAKGAADRTTVLVHLKNGDAGYLTVSEESRASLLDLLTPWLREHGIGAEAGPAA
jgi:hypothetical protein